MFVGMEVKLTWIERMLEMSKKECIPLGDTPAATIYSAIHYNRKEIKKRKMKFRVQKDKTTNKEFVCRIQ